MLEQPKAEKVQNGDFFYVFEKLLYSVHFNSVNLYDMTIFRHFFFNIEPNQIGSFCQAEKYQNIT